MAVSSIFKGSGVGSLLVCAEQSRTPPPYEMKESLDSLLTKARLRQLGAAADMMKNEVKNMLGHVENGCLTDCMFVGSQLDEVLHRAQNAAVISGNLGVALGEALLGLFLHGFNVRQFKKAFPKRHVNGVNFDKVCPHMLQDPLATPLDCIAVGLDYASLRPPLPHRVVCCFSRRLG